MSVALYRRACTDTRYRQRLPSCCSRPPFPGTPPRTFVDAAAAAGIGLSVEERYRNVVNGLPVKLPADQARRPAAQVKVSARTVQRRIQALMVKAGATTRIQLGWYARHRGWV
ncbi:hypothetical protein [Streptomyces sp. NBC_01217]|uniref:hypothetical protein n=1 Tax=Streptomyces sp. NBC_01217 TaxID=2903779 RepID=UPI002E140BB1|nr:hypothetical protein OG507_07645 [Streptomyces sp. NBC_01217]